MAVKKTVKKAAGRGGKEGLRRRGVKTVHVAIPDLDASLRERRLALDDVETAFGPGGTFVNVLHKWDSGESVIGEPPFVGEAMSLDWNSVRDYPFEADAALVFSDYAGPSAQLSPRELLKAQIKRARAMGFKIQAALEFEFHVLDEAAETLRDQGFDGFGMYAPDNRCWASQSAAIYSDYVADLNGVLDTLGVGVYGLGLELGPGCFEATLRATDPLRAADDAVLFKTFTKAFSRRRGLTATFMAQLSAQHAGLSGHVHLSLSDARTGKPLFHDAKDKDGMSKTMRHAIAGLVDLAPEALALCAHTANAYRRLTPGNWAPKTATWAVQNYAAAVRAVPSPAKLARMEFRLPASDTNPYLAIALTLAGALHGIETKAKLPAPITRGGPDETPEGVPGLPHDLLEAADRLDVCKPARALFGDRFVDHFVATRRHEEAVIRKHVSAFERARYIEAV
ncbi:MAG: glutamine synthetase [Rhodospirillaceae bacterium]|nr:glutamine synthetase [Rhodospirillaceae bacterium]|tara:strand:+ start:545 stop:1903 length:1359 start_codon:yes stop_codon:yes gene_type:complete